MLRARSQARAFARFIKRADAPRRLGLARRRERRAVLFVCGPGGEARRYRCDHRREQLALAGIDSDFCYRREVSLAPLARRYACIVLYRVPWDPGVERLVTEAQGRDCALLADFDDLVFDSERAHLIRALDGLSGAERRAHLTDIAQQRRTLASCHAATVSTAPLREAASRVMTPVEVVHNVVSAEMVEHANAARRAAGERQEPQSFRVGYLSGTPTHDRDFLEAADGLLGLLERDALTTLVIVGEVTLDGRFDEFRDRVERVQYQPWRRLPALIASLDVSLAPLELDNEFTACKSAVKFLEAGLVGVPTLASPRDDFARVISNGENGLLCDSIEEWTEGLERMRHDVQYRARLGHAAREDVLLSHTTTSTASEAAESLRRLLRECLPDEFDGEIFANARGRPSRA